MNLQKNTRTPSLLYNIGTGGQRKGISSRLQNCRTHLEAQTKKEYEEAVRLLDNLIDTVGEDENHPLASLMEIVGFLIEKYEDEHILEITKI